MFPPQNFRVRQWHWLFLLLIGVPFLSLAIQIGSHFSASQPNSSEISPTAGFLVPVIWVFCAVPCFCSIAATHHSQNGAFQKARIVAAVGGALFCGFCLAITPTIDQEIGDRNLDRILYLTLPHLLAAVWSFCLILWAIFARFEKQL